MKTPEQVRSERESVWMALPGVIGVGVGAREDGAPCLVVFASGPHEAHKRIPAAVDGYGVRVEVVGDVRVGGGGR
jgi:hypothetical protein